MLILSLSSAHFSSSFGSFLTEKSCGERCSIATKILLNFITEYATNETRFLSFIVSKDAKTSFQKEMLDNLYHDPTLSNYSHNTLYVLNNNSRRRQYPFSIIFVQDSESLKYVLLSFEQLTNNIEKYIFIFQIRSILDSSRLRNYDLSLKYLTVIEHSAKKSNKMLERITEILWKNGLISSHILSEDELGIWTLYTFIPYQTNCIEIAHFRMASFTPLNFTRSMNLSMEQMYPGKLKNFNQCPLYAVAPMSLPFVKHCSINGSINYSGIDVNIVTQISRKLNFRIIFEYVNFHGMILSNSTITGGIGLVCD